MKKKIFTFAAILSLICAIFVFVACVPKEDLTPSGHPSGDDKNEENIDYSQALIIEDNIITGLTQYGKTLSKIVLPESVTSIGNRAFNQCYRLTSIEIPSSIKSIESGAFMECSSLKSIEIPNSITSIGASTFLGCSKLTSVKIPNSVISIGNYAFKDCSSLTNVEIPESVAKIGEGAFRGCSQLIIYCEVESQPSGWDVYWNYSNRPVVWNYKNN